MQGHIIEGPVYTTLQTAYDSI